MFFTCLRMSSFPYFVNCVGLTPLSSKFVLGLHKDHPKKAFSFSQISQNMTVMIKQFITIFFIKLGQS